MDYDTAARTQRALFDIRFALLGIRHGLPLEDWARNRLRESAQHNARRMLCRNSQGREGL